MSETFEIPVGAIRPPADQVLSGAGFTRESGAAARFQPLVATALDAFDGLAQAKGIIAEVAVAEFETIYRSEVQDQQPTPVSRIFPRAEFIYLFGVTIGPAICDRITGLFQDHDFAQGFVLDAVASAGTENASAYVLKALFELPVQNRPQDRSAAVLDYNPGYCGWHMSGQKKLLARLGAERIGITLNASFLMQPIKSLSGALIGGRPEIHDAGQDFPCCAECPDPACHDRIRRIKSWKH